MKIGIDVDEVLSETVEEIIKFYNTRFNANLTRDDYFSFDYSKVWNMDQDKAQEIVKEFFEQDLLKHAKIVDGSIEALTKLSKNHELIIITSREQRIHEMTKEWLEEKFPELFSQVHFAKAWRTAGKRKWQICRDEEIDLMIDDGKHIVRDCAKKGIECILFNAPWNQDLEEIDKVTRLNSWKEILEKIKELEK